MSPRCMPGWDRAEKRPPRKAAATKTLFGQARSFQDFGNGGKGVFLALRDFDGEGAKAGFAFLATEDFFEKARFEHFDQAILPEFNVLLSALAAGFEMLAKFFDGGSKFLDTTIVGSNGADHRRMPAVAGHHERKHGMELLFQSVGALAIGLIQNEDVADFHQAGFHVLDVVAKAGNEDDEDAIREAHDVDLVLADSDGFDKHLALPRRIEQKRDFSGGTREPTKESARGHGANENPSVAGVALHADAVAKDGPAGVRACRVHGDHADAVFTLAVIRGKTIDQRALASAGRASDAGEIRLAGVGKKLAKEFFGFRRVIFDGCDGARDGTHVAGTDLGGPVVNGECHCGTSLCEWKVANGNIPLADYLNSQNRSSPPERRMTWGFELIPWRGQGFHCT